MTITINPERLAQLNNGEITLNKGPHESFEAGHCAMEVVAWLANLGHTDAPECASPVLRSFTIRLNDHWNPADRQRLAPLLPRMIGTADDGQDHTRAYLAIDWAARTVTPAYLDLAGLTDHAENLRSLDPIIDAETASTARPAIRAARKAAADAAAYAAAYAADAAAYAAYAAAADAAYAAAAAADAAAYAAYAADAAAAAAYAADAADAAAAAADAAAYAAAYAAAGLKKVAADMRTSALELLNRMIDPSAAA